jgi:hypothetical protein
MLAEMERRLNRAVSCITAIPLKIMITARRTLQM